MSSENFARKIAWTRKRIGRKGVSPLIATVLLIAFAVALGAVVMNWGQSYVSHASGAECEGLVIAWASGPCTLNGAVNIHIKNSGEKTLDNIKLVIEGQLKELTSDPFLDSPLEPGKAKNTDIVYDKTAYGEIVKIRAFPKIKDEHGYVLCENVIEKSNPAECS